MDATELNEVCRLCPSSGVGDNLMHVFDERLSVKNNMKEVIQVTTGVEILESDFISKKICQRCCTKTLQMFLFRQDALTQDRVLKERCSRFLEDKGIRLPNTCVTIKRERRDSFVPLKRLKVEFNDITPTTSKAKRKKVLHSSVADIYKTYPHIKLPKKCLERHLAPVVSFTMGEVEKYFRTRKLDMKSFIYKPSTKPRSNAVAKKRTALPTKRKMVSPIKICKKVLDIHELQSSGTNIDYICTSVSKPKEKKKSFLSSDGKMDLTSEMSHGSKATESPPLTKIIESPKLTELCNENKPDMEIPILQPPAHVMPTLETVKTPAQTPTASDQISEDSRESCSSGTSKPEFIESLGLTPTVTATKSKTLHVCNLCGSVHNNAFKLKTHSRKHMVCQFCKLRFKSLETKQNHVDNSCQVKKILNSSGPVVELEKVHLNLAVRKTFKDAFSDFEAIPDLTILDLIEQVTVKTDPAPIPARPVTGSIITLFDDEDLQTKSSNPLLEAPVSLSDMGPPAAPASVNVVSMIRPDVRIQNDTVLNSIVDSIGDKQAVKDLLALLKPRRRRTVDKVLQTDLPATKDIKINNAEGFCEFKNLKEQLLSYKIPVSITDGPFHVAYQYKNISNCTKSMALWNDLPVIHARKKTPLPTNTFKEKGGAINSQVQSADISSSLQPNITENVSEPTVVQNSSLSIDANISTSASPLIESCTTSARINKRVSIPKVLAKSALSYASTTSRRSLSSGEKDANTRPIPSATLSRKSLPVRISNTRKSNNLVPKTASSSSATFKDTSLSISTTTTDTAKVQLNSSSKRVQSRNTDPSSTSISETSRVRVKNVWELQ